MQNQSRCAAGIAFQATGLKTTLLRPMGSDKEEETDSLERGHAEKRKKSRIETDGRNERNERSKRLTLSSTPPPPSPHQAHSHSANTHHLALRSARTRPRHVPFSPILITVSHAVVNPTSVSSTARFPYSCFLVRRIIF